MSFSFSSLIRLIVLLALGTTMLAVGLSRLDPPRPGWRARRQTEHFNVNEYYLNVTDRTPRWLDAGTGQVVAGALPEGDVLESASSSPWVDEKGRRQVIGRWSRRTEEGPLSMSQDFGLARYTFPGGEVLDQVSTEIVPVGPPCWYPGTRARVVFAAGDGQLYHYAFEPEGPVSSDEGSGRDRAPSPIAWRCKPPGGGRVFIGDLTMPEDPRLDGRLIASLRHQEGDEEVSRRFTRTQLWWLKLNHAGTEIVEAGPMLARDDRTSDGVDDRAPAVATLADGRAALAYLSQGSGGRGWDLHLAPITVDDRRIPSASVASSRVILTGCAAATPAVSPDGRWITAILDAPAQGRKLTRVALDAGSARRIASRD